VQKTTSQIKEIVLRGGSVILNAEDYTTTQLKEIALICKSKNGTLTLKNAKEKTNSDLNELALLKCVIFDLT